jgi:hypothetical protein
MSVSGSWIKGMEDVRERGVNAMILAFTLAPEGYGFDNGQHSSGS